MSGRIRQGGFWRAWRAIAHHRMKRSVPTKTPPAPTPYNEFLAEIRNRRIRLIRSIWSRVPPPHPEQRRRVFIPPAPASVPQLEQSYFRFRQNSGTTDASPTWLAAENADHSMPLDTPFRIRFSLEETAGVSPTTNRYRLQINRNGSGWFTYLEASASFLLLATGTRTDVGAAGRGATDEHLLSGAGTHSTGTDCYGQLPNATINPGPVGNDVAANGHVEVEWCCELSSADGMGVGDTLDMRIIINSSDNHPTGASLVYTVVPRVTAIAVGAADVAPLAVFARRRALSRNVRM